MSTPVLTQPRADVSRYWTEVRETALASARTSTGAVPGNLAEDIAQETVLAVLERRRPDQAPPALVRRVAGNLAARAWHAHRAAGGGEYLHRASSVDMRARQVLLDRAATRAQALGRELTSREVASIAAEIRSGWSDVRHRPRPDFHEDLRLVPLDACPDPWARDALEARFAVPSAEDEALAHRREGPHLAAALDAVEAAGGDRRRTGALRLLHNALAEGCGAPLAVAGSMSQRRCTRARRVVGTTSRDVLRVVDAWAAGVEDERTALLFAPYGGIGRAQQQAVAELYRELSGYAGAVYASALMFANTRRPGTGGRPPAGYRAEGPGTGGRTPAGYRAEGPGPSAGR